MKKDTTSPQYFNATTETWTKTMNLRWVIKEITFEKVLQQELISTLGISKWEDIQIETK